MTRSPRLRSPLRRRQTPRRLRLEQLDSRHVLTTLVAAATVDPPPVLTGEAEPVSAVEWTAREDASQVTLDVEGVLHVRPAADAADVTIRQFLDYRRDEVVEVQTSGEWISVPAAQVSVIQVELTSSEQKLVVAPEVAIGVEPTMRAAADQVLEESLPTPIETVIRLTTSWGAVGPSDGTSSDGGLAVPSMAGPIAPPLAFPSFGGSPEGEPIKGGVVTAPTPPQISDFRVEQSDGIWIFTGRVTDDKSVAGLVVRFGGLLNGATATVNEQGVFEFTRTFPPGTTGTVTAVTSDTDDLTSNQVSCTIG